MSGGMTFEEACVQITGNHLIDVFYLQCGMPVWFIILFALSSFALLFYIWIKQRSYKSVFLTAVAALITWKAVRVLVVVLFFKADLLVSSELAELIIQTILAPIGFYFQ